RLSEQEKRSVDQTLESLKPYQPVTVIGFNRKPAVRALQNLKSRLDKLGAREMYVPLVSNAPNSGSPSTNLTSSPLLSEQVLEHLLSPSFRENARGYEEYQGEGLSTQGREKLEKIAMSVLVVITEHKKQMGVLWQTRNSSRWQTASKLRKACRNGKSTTCWDHERDEWVTVAEMEQRLQSA
ncbi:MAG: hypothetical protein WA029_14400, partial [Anaerolineae bacterium]